MASSGTQSRAQAAVAKSMELREAYAALLGSGRNPTRNPTGASPLSKFSNHCSAAAQDYPVFTPSYNEEPLSGHAPLDPKLLNNLCRFMAEGGEATSSELVKYGSKSLDDSVYSSEQLSKLSSTLEHNLIMQTAPGIKILKPGMTNFDQKSPKKPLFQPLSSGLKTRGSKFPWPFHRSKKPPKSELSSDTIRSEEWGVPSPETLKKELQIANEKRFIALAEVAEMRSSLKELQQKLASLESCYGELKKSLLMAETKPINGRSSTSSNSKSYAIPVSDEVMIEGFLQIVSEARLSSNHFCKAMIKQIDDDSLMEKITPNRENSRETLYHLEALISQCLYQDFENCAFQKNGSPKVLDLDRRRFESFSEFVGMRNMRWSEALRKGSGCYSEDFSIFCNQKMSCVVSALDWWRPWPEPLLESFFVAAKCVWLLHLLAFAFDPPAMILRVGENASFDALYMEDVVGDKRRRRSQAAAQGKVRVMVVPGFYLQERVFRCRVLCKYGDL